MFTNKIVYPLDHWALQPCTLTDPKVIGVAAYKGSEYAIYANPTDKRGYRCIVRLIDNKDMASTFNREYTPEEHRGLSLVVELVERAFRNILPIVQTFKAGNNSHQFENRIVSIGKAEEPSILHTHIIGRGDPEMEYIPGVKLDGPVPGLNFDMMNQKVKWKEGEMERTVQTLKQEIEKLNIEGLKVMTRVFCEVYLIRHGQTDWNVQGKLQGHTDEPLNSEGESQALALREKFENIKFAAVYSSDLSRASKTATIALGQQQVEIVKTPVLRERSFGSWEGKLFHELRSKLQNTSFDIMSKEELLSYKWQSDIESYAEVYARLHQFIKAQAIMGSSILLSSHGGVLRALLYHLDYKQGHKWQVFNCAYIKLLVNEAGEITLVESEGTKLTNDAAITF